MKTSVCFSTGILIHKYALLLGYSALEVTYIDDAMSIDKDFDSNTFPSNVALSPAQLMYL